MAGVMRTLSTSVFACHSAACRPPRSGGTGGSLKGGPGGSAPVPDSTDPHGPVLMGRIREVGNGNLYQARRKVLGELADGILASKEGRRLIDEMLSDDFEAKGSISYSTQRLVAGYSNTIREGLQKVMDSIEAGGPYSEDSLVNKFGLDSVDGVPSMETIAARALAYGWWSDWSGGITQGSLTSMLVAAETHKGLSIDYITRQHGSWMDSLRDPWSMKMAKVLNDVEYRNTQKFLRETLGPDVKTVRLYRGVKGQYDVRGSAEVEVGMRPFSSWAMDLPNAMRFARSGHLLTMDVPIEMIQSTPVTGRGYFDENEILVIGRPSTATARSF